MAQISISDELYAQVSAFKQVVEALMEVSLDVDACVETLLRLAPDYVLTELLGNAEVPVLVNAIRELGHSHPDQVYKYIAETIDRGQAIVESQNRTDVRRRLGFEEPDTSDAKSKEP